MDIALDEVIFFDAITSTPSTGAAVDGDAAPTFAVYEEATDTDIGVGGNMTKRTSLTGNYRGTFTLSAANGFEVGKWYSVIGSAVVGGVTGKAVLKSFRVVLAEAVVGEPKVDVGGWLGTAVPAPGTAGVPSVDAIRISTSATAADNLETAALAYSATRGLAGTALPAAAADAAGGLPISDAGGLDLDAVGSAVTSGTHGNAALKTLIDAVDNFVDTELAAVATTLGTPAGVSISADLLVIDNFVDDLESRLTATRAGYLDNLSAGAAAQASALSTAQTDITSILADTNELQVDWVNGGRLDLLLDSILADTDSLDTTKITMARAGVLTDWIDGGRLDLILDARASQASVDTIDDFLDTEVAATLAAVDTEIAAILTAVSTTIPATLSGLLTTAMAEGYRADGATGSVRDLLYEMKSQLGEFAIVGVTKTNKKIDGTATAFVETLDSATTPTAIARTT